MTSRNSCITRRELLAASAGAIALATTPAFRLAHARSVEQRRPGRLKQSVSRWTYGSMPLPELCRAAKALGIVAIDLLQPDEWPVVREAGLVASLGYPTVRRDFIATGFNDRANHPMLLRELRETIPRAASAGVPSVIAMFGNRGGRSDADGMAACIEGLRTIAPVAEQHGVTVVVELLNSKVDHKDYQGDHTAFGAAVIDGVGSPRVKLLYDIYHMQIMEGDVIRTIREHITRIGHFHTGGVPGRHEIDDTQELNYRSVARAIADTGFAGYVAHEFVPSREPLRSLRDAVAICDV
ncbi:MAG TPA: TIM barrel protein [Gemmatimonadales bacterium]|nr:TIM barrel protein [Gemmatimonadales bacterium]